MSAQFFKIILSPHDSKFYIPDEFVIKYGADLRDVVFLEVPTGAIWKVKLQNSNGTKWLKGGWNQFKEYYSIAFGYFLLFQYNGNSHFSVFIFDLSASEIKYPSGIPVRQEPNRMKLDKSDLNYATQKDKKEKLIKQNLYDEAYKFKVAVVDPSTSKVTTISQHSKKKIDTSLDASYCRYLAKEHCNKIPVVDPSATKMTTTTRHHEKKTSASLDTSHCRYPLRNKQLKELKLGKTNAVEDLLYVAQKAKRKKANNVKLVKGDVEERCKVGDPSASTTTNRHNEKITTTILDASHHRYSLRSKQHKEVKLEQWEAGGNMRNETPKNKVVADSPYCKRQNPGLPASSPIRVKLEKQDNLFCAADKAKGKERNNVKLDTSYKGKDSTASEMTILGKKKMLPSEKHNWDIYFNPHFTVTMQPAYVSRNFQLDIPVNFFKKLLKYEETIVNLRVSNGRTWRAKLFDIQSNCPKIESSGWRDFVLGNNLKENDTCVFELTDGFEPVLAVTIFRATTPVS